jgi:tRNA (mo5U34)-methyltransferase
MIPFSLHRRIPLIRRPFFQRDQAIRELVEARERLAQAEADLADARRSVAASCEVTPAKVKPLAGQPGETGHDIPSPLQRRINEIPWYHEFDFPNGLVARSTAPDAASHRALWAFMKEQLNRIDFTGKSVLDIGCWDGYWSFLAESRGAARVLATDDATQNFAASAGVELAKELLGSAIEIRKDVSVYQLTRVGGTFDIVLFLGVYYHLVDPIYAIAEIRDRCHESSLVVVEGDYMPEASMGVATSAFFDIGHGSRCFVPTLPCLRQIMEAAYFEIVSEATYDGSPEQPVHRVLAVYRPIVAENPRHLTRPPFGLHNYDPRFRDAR